MFCTLQDYTDVVFSSKALENKRIFACWSLAYNYKCNFSCRVCYDKDKDTEQTLSLEDLERWTKECAEKDIGIIWDTGEPFLHLDFMKNIFIPLMEKYNAKYIIYTNGFWGDDDSILSYVMSNVKFLSLSVDCFHAKFVKNSTYLKIIEAAKKSTITKFMITQMDYERASSKSLKTAIPAGKVSLYIKDYDEDLYFDYSDIADKRENATAAHQMFTNDFNGHLTKMDGTIWGTSVNDIVFEDYIEPIGQFYLSNAENLYDHYKSKILQWKKKLYNLKKSHSAVSGLDYFTIIE